jgi:translocator assembly and maintenance protein 41
MNNNLTKLKEIIPKLFPRVDYVFAYGSAVVQQKNNVGKMIDLIYVVNDINEFHKQNMKINSNHYSGIAKFSGADATSKINRIGTKIYYNPSITVDNILIKYGTIQERDFIISLTHWDNLFVAGRFHKPVVRLIGDRSLEQVYLSNLEAAVIYSNY